MKPFLNDEGGESQSKIREVKSKFKSDGVSDKVSPVNRGIS